MSTPPPSEEAFHSEPEICSEPEDVLTRGRPKTRLHRSPSLIARLGAFVQDKSRPCIWRQKNNQSRWQRKKPAKQRKREEQERKMSAQKQEVDGAEVQVREQMRELDVGASMEADGPKVDAEGSGSGCDANDGQCQT